MFFCLGLHLALFSTLVELAPVPGAVQGTQGTEEIMNKPEFQDAAENAYSLMMKILDEIPAVHQSWIHTQSLSLDEDLSTLQYLKDNLNLPGAPVLQPLSENFTLEMCLNRIVDGLKTHITMLKVISNASHSKTEQLEGLLFDIRDFVLQIHMMQKMIHEASASEEASVTERHLQADLGPRLDSAHMSKVAGHLVLKQLRTFGRGVSRILRSMIPSLRDSESQDS